MQTFIKNAGAIIATLALATVSPILLDLVLVGLIVYGLCGAPQLVRAVALLVVLKYLNPMLASYDSLSGLLFWALPIAMGFRTLPMINASQIPLLLPLWAFSLVAAILSYLSSPAVTISLMKIGTFMWVISAVLIAFLNLSAAQLKEAQKWFMALALCIVGISALTLAVPAVAYQLIPGSLQGIFNHPQSLGTFVAPICAWSVAGVMAIRGGSRPLYISIVVLTTGVMLLSLARTAAVASAAGIVIACVTPFLRRASASGGIASAGRVFVMAIIASAAIGAVALSIEGLDEAVNGFVLKRNSPNVESSFYESRGKAIEWQWRNFRAKPWLGNGFGVFPDGEFRAGIVEVYGIPVSAPVEKGFFPTAILEETGVLGGALFLLLLVMLARQVHRNVDVRWIAAFWAAVIINTGEAVILAPGGVGLYIWIAICIAVASGRLSDRTELSHALEKTKDEVPAFANLMP